jgi:hypothetical protein
MNAESKALKCPNFELFAECQKSSSLKCQPERHIVSIEHARTYTTRRTKKSTQDPSIPGGFGRLPRAGHDEVEGLLLKASHPPVAL